MHDDADGRPGARLQFRGATAGRTEAIFNASVPADAGRANDDGELLQSSVLQHGEDVPDGKADLSDRADIGAFQTTSELSYWRVVQWYIQVNRDSRSTFLAIAVGFFDESFDD